ncbi:Transposable element Tcb1 transposase, partial [Stegodyphus mimosarum]
MIIGFRAKGGSISETAEFVNCSRAAVVKVYRAWQNGTVQNQRRGKCGAPRAIDDRGERRLRRCVRADRRATVEQLTTKMNQGATKSVSQSTIQRTLLRLGLRSRRLVRAPMLTAVHRRRRLEFARQYSSWTSTEWRQVAFSDESRFMLHRTDGRWRIRRETSERNHPATIAGTVQAGGGSIMVWGMFSWHSLGSLIIVEGTMDQYKYASVLADHVHPYMRIVFPQDDGIFQQDNARCHTAASDMPYLSEAYSETTVDEDAIRKLIEFGDDYGSAIGQPMRLLDVADGNNNKTEISKLPSKKTSKTLSLPPSQRQSSLSNDSDSDSDDLHHVIEETAKALLFARGTLKRRQSGDFLSSAE